jgi:hypothetical protein
MVQMVIVKEGRAPKVSLDSVDENELFQPNNLSRRAPEFVPVDDPALHASVRSLLSDYYRLPGLSSVQIASVLGANVVSRNLLVTTPNARYILKSRAQDQHRQLVAEAQLAMRLERLSANVPRVVTAAAGAPTCIHSDACWALYEFDEGVYFSGQGTELDSAAASFSNLTTAAQQVTTGALTGPSEEDSVFLTDLAELLNENALKAISDSAVTDLCIKHRAAILDSLEDVRSKRAEVEALCLPMHLDYHPLNLLMKNGEVVCILDLEHLKTYPCLAGLGFAAYKLIRQALVDPDLRAREFRQPSMVERWLTAWQRAFPEPIFDARQLGLGARYRVLSLIHLILNASIRRGDHRSNFDLAKQIGSLYEIGVIFGSA